METSQTTEELESTLNLCVMASRNKRVLQFLGNALVCEKGLACHMTIARYREHVNCSSR